MRELEFDLDCRYDSRACFYGKAKVRVTDDLDKHLEELFSYGTLVASYIYDKAANVEIYKYEGKYSQTTTRHQKEFFKQRGLGDKQIKELFNKGELFIYKEEEE
jgi:hypothetical protein